MKRALFLLGLSAFTLSACASGVTSHGSPASSSEAKVASPPVADIAATHVPARDVTTAAGLGVVRGPQITTLQVDTRKTALALDSFRTSCPGLVRRSDASGLTEGSDWVAACNAAKTWTGDAISFFAEHMDAVQVCTGRAFATGYFEPEIAGCRMRQAGCDVPVYKRPSDLIDVDLGQFSDEMKGRNIRGKVSGTKFVQYDDRAAIEGGSLAGRGLEIAYASDVVEFFFLQIQGSGRLKLPDGNVMRIGYDSQNGRGYTGIGKLMRDRGLITDASMQGIVAFLHANHEEGRKIMQENKSYIFFRELTGARPLGAMGYPVVGEASIAVDVKFIPLGAPVWLSLDRAEPNGIWIAQDTGGAIKGPNRIDTFWGGWRPRAGDCGRHGGAGCGTCFSA